VASVTIEPATTRTFVGDQIVLTVTPRDAAGKALLYRTITFASSNNSVASVEAFALATGLVRALAPGEAMITATSEGKSAQATIAVDSIQSPSWDY